MASVRNNISTILRMTILKFFNKWLKHWVKLFIWVKYFLGMVNKLGVGDFANSSKMVNKSGDFANNSKK